MSNTFKVARYSTVAWVWTILFILALLYFLFYAVLGLLSGIASPFDIGISVILLWCVIYGWIRSVRGYRIDDTLNQIVVERAGPGRVSIPFDKIQKAEFRPEVGAFFNTSILSIGGLFGWSGRARVRNPIDVRSDAVEVYGTNAAKSVALQLESGLVLILTPEDAQGFVSALQDKLPRQRGRTITKIKRK